MSAPLSQSTTTKQCVVSRSFDATTDTTVSLVVGTTVDVVADSNPDWWYVKVAIVPDGGADSPAPAEGYFPSNHLITLSGKTVEEDTTESVPALPLGWQKHLNADNRPYYHNISTNVTQWDVPVATEEQRPFSALVNTTRKESLHAKPSTNREPISKSESLPVQQSPPVSHSTPGRRPTITPPKPPSFGSLPASSESAPQRTAPKPPKPPPPPPRKRAASVTVAEVDRGKTSSKDPEVFQYFKISDELKSEIAKFSIQGYAEEHFKTKMKWGVFGRKTVKACERNLGFHAKLSHALTVLDKDLTKNALNLFHSIQKYMDKFAEGEPDEKRGQNLLALVRSQDELRYSKNGMMEELFCQLVQQTTNNPHPCSLERGWELLAVLVLCGLVPQTDLMIVIIGHANACRYTPSATGAFALIVHTALVCHVKALKETGSLDSTVKFPPICDLDYEKHIVPLRSGFIAEKIFGVDPHGTFYRELFLKDQEYVFPMRSSLDDKVPEILKLLCSYILEKGGRTRGGIFREAANTETVKELLRQLEVGNYRSLRLTDDNADADIAHNPTSDANCPFALLIGDREILQAPAIPIDDVLIVADVLKIWFRKMPEPITTFGLYSMCITAGTNGDLKLAKDIVDLLPVLNANILKYLCRFLRELSESGHITNMETVNLSLVFAPNCIQSSNPHPQLFASNANYERKCFKLFIDVLAPE